MPGFVLLCVGLFFGVFSLFEYTLMGWGWLFQAFVSIFLFTLGFVMCIGALILNTLSELLQGIKGTMEKQVRSRR